jgi:hypothetical protein
MSAAAEDMKAATMAVIAQVKHMVREDVILGCAQITLEWNVRRYLVCILFFI